MPDDNEPDTLPKLVLPKRFEILQQTSEEAGVDVKDMVQRVDAAASRIDSLLRRVHSSGGGLFEIFLGKSGSGKTTFLSTLPKFFERVAVFRFAKEQHLAELPSFIERTAVGTDALRIYVIEGRDNPTAGDVGVSREVFDRLRELFRTPAGKGLVVWPITDEEQAAQLAATAWKIGGDSVVDLSTRGTYNFSGLEKERYLEVADVTVRNLTGDSLEAFGITSEMARELLPQSETISQFYYWLEDRAATLRNETWSVLRERVRPKVWFVLAGDKVKEVDATVGGLTQGTINRVDIDLLGEYIDNPANKALYLDEWRRRRAKLAFVLRTLDVRLFDLPPNSALAAARAFGTAEDVAALGGGSENKENAVRTFQTTRLFKSLQQELGGQATPYSPGRSVSKGTEQEYLRLQQSATTRDKSLNKALGQLVKASLAAEGIDVEVVPEKQTLPGSELKPDIQVIAGPADVICLEVTWRSTGSGIEGELPERQNTLTRGHIMKYVLEKVIDYIRDIGL